MPGSRSERGGARRAPTKRVYVKMGYTFWCRTFHLKALELTLTSFIVFSLVFDGSGGGQELRYGSLANRLLCKPVKIRFLTKRN